MGQVTWRASDELIERLREVAAERKQSMNEVLTHLAESLTNPDLAGSDRERTRERLRRAGLLVEPEPLRGVSRPDPELLAEARRELGKGLPLVSDIVAEDRGPR